MAYQSPADFCAKYANAHKGVYGDGLNDHYLAEATVVGETLDTARVDAIWFYYGHVADCGYYDGEERTAFVLVKRSDGWHVDSEKFSTSSEY